MQTNQITQIEQANEKLLALSANVTTEDRNSAKNHFSEFTVIQYLKGRGRNLDTAITLIELFTKRIKERDKVLG